MQKAYNDEDYNQGDYDQEYQDEQMDEEDGDWEYVDDDIFANEDDQIIKNEKGNTKNQKNSGQKKVDKQIKLKPMVIKYSQCKKGGYHNGEILNMYCMQTKCAQNSVICSICYQQNHEGHQIKPLKTIIERARTYLSVNNQVNINIDSIKQLIKQSQKTLHNNFQNANTQIVQSLRQMKQTIQQSYTTMQTEFQQKMNSQQVLNIIKKLQQKDHTIQEYVTLIKQLLSIVKTPNIKSLKTQNFLDIQTIKKSFTEICQKTQKDFDVKSVQIKQGFKKYIEYIQKIANNPLSAPINYTFSQQLHHSGVSIVNPTKAKAIQGYNYHFAIMQPSLESKGNQLQVLEFKILQNTNSWIAVGICHKQTIVKNNFTFDYSSTGHGAYLISSNGGSWSTLNSLHNNVVTSFSFYKNDSIIIKFNPKTKQLNFNKKGTKQNHKLKFSTIEDDKLHLCVLFYYSSDQVQFLGEQGVGVLQ